MSNKVVNIPDLPAGTPAELVNFLTSVSQALRLLQGLGNTEDADRAMRLGEIQKLGISIPIFQGASLEKPASVTPSDRTPKAPTDMVITPGTFAHKITLTIPDDQIIQYIEIFSALESQNRSEAIRRYVYTVMYGDYGKTVELSVPVSDPTKSYTYWSRSVSFAEKRSAFHPPDSLGGYVVPGDESLAETIDNVMETLRGGAPALYNPEKVYEFNERCTAGDGRVYRSILVGQFYGHEPPDPVYWERTGILMQGDIDGVPAVAVDGNMVVDQTIISRCIKVGEIIAEHLAANQILVGHSIQSENFVQGISGIFLDAVSGIFRICDPDSEITLGNTVNGNFSRMTNGELDFFQWIAGAHRVVKSLKNIDWGIAQSGEWTELNGYWADTPTVVVWGRSIPSYSPTFSGQVQKPRVELTDIELVTEGIYRIRANGLLETEAGSVGQSIGLTTANATTATVTTTSFTCPANTRKITATVLAKGLWGEDVGGDRNHFYVNIQIRLRYYYSGAWYYTGYTAVQASLNNWKTFSVSTPTAPADIEYVRAEMYGVKGAYGYAYSADPLGFTNSITLHSGTFTLTSGSVIASGPLNYLAIGK